MSHPPGYGTGSEVKHSYSPIATFLRNATFGYIDIQEEVDEFHADTVDDETDVSLFIEYSGVLTKAIGEDVMNGIDATVQKLIDGIVLFGGITFINTARLTTHVLFSFVNCLMTETANDLILMPDPTLAPTHQCFKHADWGTTSHIIRTTARITFLFAGSAPTVTPINILQRNHRWIKGTVPVQAVDADFGAYKPFVEMTNL